MSNDRLSDDPIDADTFDRDEPDVARTAPPSAYEWARIPSNIHLARARFDTDATFRTVVDTAYGHLDFDTPDDLLREGGGLRIRITKALIGKQTVHADVEPSVELIGWSSEDFAEFAEWIDEPVSAYAHRETPDIIRHLREWVDDHQTRKAIDEASRAWKDGRIDRREYEKAVADMVDFDALTRPLDPWEAIEEGDAPGDIPIHSGEEWRRPVEATTPIAVDDPRYNESATEPDPTVLDTVFGTTAWSIAFLTLVVSIVVSLIVDVPSWYIFAVSGGSLIYFTSSYVYANTE